MRGIRSAPLRENPRPNSRTHLPDGLALSEGELERAAVAAYNCGEGNVRQAIERREDPDSRTAGRDYSRSVLAFAAGYRDLHDPAPEPQRASSPTPAPISSKV